MSAVLLDGRDAAHAMLLQVAERADRFAQAHGRRPKLAVVRGDGGAADAYLARIQASAATAHLDLTLLDTSGDSAEAIITALNADPAVDGILPLLPLPGITGDRIAALLDPQRDVDGLTPTSLGRLASGLPGLGPCTPQAAILLAQTALGTLRGRTATVVGASTHVGLPLASLLVRAGATVTIAHADTRDLAAACRTAELLFVAVGKPDLIGVDHLAPGATVIDIGVNLVHGADEPRVVGDVTADAAMGMAAFLSKVPDGVGPLTTAYLMANVEQAATARVTREI